MRIPYLILFSASFSLGCGGGTSPNGGSTTTTGGLTTTTTGGFQPMSMGAVSAFMTTASTPGAVCAPGVHWVNVPFASGGGQQTSGSKMGTVAIDGAQGMEVRCTVHDTGTGPFEVSGWLASPVRDAMGNPLAKTIFTITTTIKSGQTDALGSVTIMDDKTTTVYSSSACTVSVSSMNPADTIGIASGRVWAQVSCPELRDPSNPDTHAVCSVNPGFVLLENCAR